MVMIPASTELDAPRPPDGIADLARRAQQGDVDAFESIYRATSPAVYRVCRRMSRDEREARELLQDVFVRAWERLSTYRGQSALTTWLHRVAVNVALERIRTRQRETKRFVDDDGDTLAHRRIDNEPDARLDLDTALMTLPQGARTVFVLYLEGYSHEEIAHITGTAAGTTRAQLWRARRALARIIDR